jgi:uncharacterized protein
MPPLHFGGHEFGVGRRALFWPARRALILADLHLEKASWFAMRGQMLPPLDSLATLDDTAALIATTGARELWCLGDNFHDSRGSDRMTAPARTALDRLTASVDWHWIIGNHDPDLPDGIGGTIHVEAVVDGIVLRHEADPQERRPELSGHFHPKYQPVRGRSRPCYVMTQSKLILPAFGAFTGGLAADHPEIARACNGEAQALIPAAGLLLRFALGRAQSGATKRKVARG